MDDSDESLPPAEPPAGELAELARPASVPRRARTEATLAELARLDRAVYLAIASTPTPSLDEPLRRLSKLANNSTLWLAASGVLALGGRRGRRAAATGIMSITLTSGIVNLGLKPRYSRKRPNRPQAGLVARQTKVPTSSSFPSGHSAAGFAFATAVGHQIPLLALPLRLVAVAVAYARVHTGAHYPGDAIVGSLAGSTVGMAVGATLAAPHRGIKEG